MGGMVSWSSQLIILKSRHFRTVLNTTLISLCMWLRTLALIWTVPYYQCPSSVIGPTFVAVGSAGGGIGRGDYSGICRVGEGYMQAKAATCRLEVAAPDGAGQFAPRRCEERYCTSLRISTSRAAFQGQHPTDNGYGHWRKGEAEAMSKGNVDCILDKHSRRPGFCGRYFTNTFPRKPLSPLQTPKLKHPSPKVLFFLLDGFETRLQNPRRDDQEDQCLSECQHHDCSSLEPLAAGNWTSQWQT